MVVKKMMQVYFLILDFFIMSNIKRILFFSTTLKNIKQVEDKWTNEWSWSNAHFHIAEVKK